MSGCPGTRVRDERRNLGTGATKTGEPILRAEGLHGRARQNGQARGTLSGPYNPDLREARDDQCGALDCRVGR